MKKIIAILMTILLMAGALCITTSAADPIVMTVSGHQKSGGLVTIYNYDDFEEGWDAAMEYAVDHEWLDDNGYDRIVVDLRADWNANEEGEFTADGGDLGFKWGTIRVYEEAIITLNLNGKTINRGLTENEYNGEVIYVDDEADLIINNGTITGGNSDNGAGGIHIKDDVKVTLNNVNLVNNVTDGDCGGGLAMYDGSTLVMNGGSIVGNTNDSKGTMRGVGAYVNDGTATFNNVRFYDNQFTMVAGHGTAVYADGANVTLDNCLIESNGVWGKIGNAEGHGSLSTLYSGFGAILTVKNSTIKGNGSGVYAGTYIGPESCNLFYVYIDSTLIIENCTITENLSDDYVLESTYGYSKVTNTTFTNNAGGTFIGGNDEFTNCTFNNNDGSPDFHLWTNQEDCVVFIDCDMGDSTYNDIKLAKIIDTSAKNGVGSIFTEGSLPMLLAIIAIVISVGSVCATVVYSKKKANPAAASNAEETEGGE